MLLFAAVLVCCTSAVYSALPSNTVCYQHTIIQNACTYGNLTVAVLGKTFKAKDCGMHIDIKDIERAPFLYINSTNSTERFTVLIQDVGPQGLGPTYLQWMVTNVSINTLPDYHNIPINNVLAAYEKPLLMHGHPQPHLVQILVFRHWNTLRVPFGELWVMRRQNFAMSTLFSNTSPNLRLCGPVAGAQFWVHDSLGSSYIPSAPLPPQPGAPAPGFIPVPVPPGYVPAPAQPGYVPAPGQPGYVPAPGQPGYVPAPGQSGYPGQGQPGSAPGQSGYNPHPHGGFTNVPRKGSAVVTLPAKILYLSLIIFLLAL